MLYSLHRGCLDLRCPYQHTASKKISRVLAKHFRTGYIPMNKNQPPLRPLKDNLGLKIPGVGYTAYRVIAVWYMLGIPTEAQKSRARNTRHNFALDNQAVSSGGTHKGDGILHEIQRYTQSVNDKRYTDRLVKHAIEIQLRPNNFRLSASCISLILYIYQPTKCTSM